MTETSPYLNRIRDLTKELALVDLAMPLGSQVMVYKTIKGSCVATGLYYSAEGAIMIFRATADSVLACHQHSMKEWIGILEGEGDVAWGGLSHHVKQHDVLVVPMNTPHTFSCEVDMVGWCITMPADEGYVNDTDRT